MAILARKPSLPKMPSLTRRRSKGSLPSPKKDGQQSQKTTNVEQSIDDQLGSAEATRDVTSNLLQSEPESPSENTQPGTPQTVSSDISSDDAPMTGEETLYTEIKDDVGPVMHDEAAFAAALQEHMDSEVEAVTTVMSIKAEDKAQQEHKFQLEQKASASNLAKEAARLQEHEKRVREEKLQRMYGLLARLAFVAVIAAIATYAAVTTGVFDEPAPPAITTPPREFCLPKLAKACVPLPKLTLPKLPEKICLAKLCLPK